MLSVLYTPTVYRLSLLCPLDAFKDMILVGVNFKLLLPVCQEIFSLPFSKCFTLILLAFAGYLLYYKRFCGNNFSPFQRIRRPPQLFFHLFFKIIILVQKVSSIHWSNVGDITCI